MYFTPEELQNLSNKELNELYHQAQLVAVAATVRGDFIYARDLFEFVVNARYELMSRHGFDDKGHWDFYIQCLNQLENLSYFIANPHVEYFNFTSRALVENAMDAGIFVPESIMPDEMLCWDYVC